MRKIKELLINALSGMQGIGLNQKRDYYRYKLKTPEQRWNMIGTRLRVAMDKVGGQYK